jgi:hypothetical protein
MASKRQQLEALRRLLELGISRQGQVGLAPLLNLITQAIAGRPVSLPGGLRKVLSDIIRAGDPGGSRSAGRPLRQPEDPKRPYSPPIPGMPRSQPPGQVTRSPEEPSNSIRSYAPQGYPDEQPFFSDEFLAPTSSNVYSFQYFRRPHDRTGILYVTYKAHGLKATGMVAGSGRFRGGRKQLHGIPGAVHGRSRSNDPGPTYSYFNVPPALFTRMKQAHSKGKFVWDELRVRGTVWGHKFRYSLVVGQLVDNVPGIKGAQYVPRKATRRGFVTRSVADIGSGRRGFVSSTLPPSTSGGGFTTRRR